jgi:hypothetical protein
MSETLSKNERIAEAKQQLEAARQWLESVPLDCDPLEIVRQETIVRFWPARIAELVKNRG